MTAAERLGAALATLNPRSSVGPDNAEPLFPSQRCLTCGDEHPGASCPEPDLFGGES